MNTLYLCGAGNPEGVRLALNINKVNKRWNRIVILDDDPIKKGQTILGIDIAGPFSNLKYANPDADEVVNLVARTTKRRQSAWEKIRNYGLPFAPLVDITVDITGVQLGKDIIVYPGVIFCANAIIGEGSVVFAGAIIGHGCNLGRFCVIAPGAVVNARVILGDGVYVGTNASILPDIKIGPWATIGANSAVVQDVPAGATVMGVPAQTIMAGQETINGNLLRNKFEEQQNNNQNELKAGGLRKLREAQEKYIENLKKNLNNYEE